MKQCSFMEQCSAPRIQKDLRNFGKFPDRGICHLWVSKVLEGWAFSGDIFCQEGISCFME